MEEINPGNIIRVNMAIRRLERCIKPLSSKLNSLLVRPLTKKTTYAKREPEPQKHLHRSCSNTHIRENSSERPKTESNHLKKSASNQNISENQTSNINKKKDFQTIRSMLSPALKMGFPKLIKPNLNTLENSGNKEIKVSSFAKPKHIDNITNNNKIKTLSKFIIVNKTPNKNTPQKKSVQEIFLAQLRKEKGLTKSVENSEKSFDSLGNSTGSFEVKLEDHRPKILRKLSMQKRLLLETPEKAPKSPLKKINSLTYIQKTETNMENENTILHSVANSYSIELNSVGQRVPVESMDILHLYRRKTFDVGAMKILSCRIDDVDDCIACGCEDGIIRLFSLHGDKQIKGFLIDEETNDIPITSLRWKPHNVDRLLLTTKATGNIFLWDVEDKKCVVKMEEDNYLYSCDFNFSGEEFATGGSDTVIRIYDLMTQKPKNYLTHTNDKPGHSNRVYDVKFSDSDNNLLISGGWDGNLFLWDLRMADAIDFISGPMICGDSIDIRKQEILTGSWRNENQIELWDMRNLKFLKSIVWKQDDPHSKSFIYSCCFNKIDSNLIVAGSTGKCELRLFERKYNFNLSDMDEGFEYGVFCLEFCRFSNDLICATGEGKCEIFKMKKV